MMGCCYAVTTRPLPTTLIIYLMAIVDLMARLVFLGPFSSSCKWNNYDDAGLLMVGFVAKTRMKEVRRQ